MTKHTPGPWEVNTPNGLLIVADGVTLARMAYSIGGFSQGSISNSPGISEAEANARLIASSPELLEALAVLIDHAKEAYPHFEDTRGKADIRKAEAAIAKAEGRG